MTRPQESRVSRASVHVHSSARPRDVVHVTVGRAEPWAARQGMSGPTGGPRCRSSVMRHVPQLSAGTPTVRLICTATPIGSGDPAEATSREWARARRGSRFNARQSHHRAIHPGGLVRKCDKVPPSAPRWRQACSTGCPPRSVGRRDPPLRTTPAQGVRDAVALGDRRLQPRKRELDDEPITFPHVSQY
jgi:hypothetical protein